jgi:predicted AAA+ superfamily ATPase
LFFGHKSLLPIRTCQAWQKWSESAQLTSIWIQGDISDFLAKNNDLIQIIQGPRQCGKSSLRLHLGKDFLELSLDDPALRDLAERDPELFLSQFGDKKLFIDEAQYAPNLFPSLKRRINLLKRSGQASGPRFRLTGSNQIVMDQKIKESLAGRASFFDLNTLSVSEILAAKHYPIQEILYRGGWPELYAYPDKDVKKYLDDYISSYIEKDIVLSAGIQKRREFLQFLQLLAGRVGELLDMASLGRDVGVDGKTIKDWVSVLERMHIIGLVMPYSSNLSKRLIKSPKVYFWDTGLACRLQGWTSSMPIMTSPQQGHLFENLVFSELAKLNINFQLGWRIFHWRSREGEEIDFLIQRAPQDFIFIEAKVTSYSPVRDHSTFTEVKKIFKKSPPPLLLYNCPTTMVLHLCFALEKNINSKKLVPRA